MSEAKHTPGPWAVRTNEFDDWGLVRGADGYPVASCSVEARIGDFREQTRRSTKEWNEGPPEVAANARLIAATPDLLEACLAAETLLSDFDRGVVYAYSVNEGVLEVVRAAIAKATEVQS